ncbi:hypothetical protein BDQ17DRAFT_1391088 [Cyathus striatus]|nr:hypothetical protein BDQ17DRAFT_1391088 [Cyathus striatus]
MQRVIHKSTAPKKALYITSQQTAHGIKQTQHESSARGMREEMAGELAKFRKRKAGKGLNSIHVNRSYKQKTDISDSAEGIAASFIQCGLIPCSPFTPSLAIATRVLELFHTTHLCCPHLAIQPFVKSLCDLHGNPFRPYLSQQFTISCTYKLNNEAPLEFSMLFTMDGNDSAKRVLRRHQADVSDLELPDSRCTPGNYYIPRQIVNCWEKMLNGMILDHPIVTAVPEKSGSNIIMGLNEKEPVEVLESPCEGRWSNMSSQSTAHMWGVFDETGIFIALCKHGYILNVIDMVASGELSKYPLAIVESLLNAFGANLGGGYDIGCQFGTTLNSSALGNDAQRLNYRSLVGSFHGHTHNHRCQLSNLATYVRGLGLEDLEGCEHFFSRSNALASQIHHSSVFHRQQSLVEFMKHMDAFETSQNLSTFLVNNYRQALEIISSEPDLKKAMLEQGIDSPEVFDSWLNEEQQYLLRLSKEPIQETLEMDYYQKLINYKCSENSKKPHKQSHKTQLRHASENAERDRESIQDLEMKLSITVHWTAQMEEWKKAAILCLDELESLIVSHMFELSKMNMSQTALQQPSHAIHSALEWYNAAAREMLPPRQSLSWDEVVSYAFLADFNLLRDTHQDIWEQVWAQPSSRILMDQHFKILCVHEEITRLNIEIRHVITYLQDKDQFLHAQEQEFSVTNPYLAHQVYHYQLEHMRFTDMHLQRFKKLAATPGFSGSILPEVGIPEDVNEEDAEYEEQEMQSLEDRFNIMLTITY